MSRPPEDTPRRGYRFHTDLPAVVHLSDGPCPCVAQDLSRGGVLLVGPLPVPAPERVDLTLKSAEGRVQVRLTARVVRCEPDPESGGARLAVSFDEVGEKELGELEVILARWMEHHPAGPLDAVRPGAPAHEMRKAAEAIPLPQRIALANRGGPREREILRHDIHPAVLDALVKNPATSIVEIRAILAAGGLAPAVLEAIAQDARFAPDPEIGAAIVTHPHATLALAERLLRQLPEATLRGMLHRPGLNPAVRDKLVKKLQR